MFKYSKTVTDATGIVQTSGTVSVWVAGTSQSVPATIYSDNAGSVKANPFALPSTGLVEFLLANQRFDVSVVTGAGTVLTTDLLALDVDELSGDITVADNLTVSETLTVTSFSPSVVNTGARADVSTATTVDLDAVTANYVRFTGTTTVNAITLSNGRWRDGVASGIFTFTNGASLILPGGANITTAAGDTFRLLGEASGVVRMVDYTRAAVVPATDSNSLAVYKIQAQTASASAQIDFVLPSGYRHFEVEIDTLVPASDEAILHMRVSEDGGSTFKSGASDYTWGNRRHTIGTGVVDDGSDPDTEMQISGAAGTDTGNTGSQLCGSIKCYHVAGTTRHKYFTWQVTNANQNSFDLLVGGGRYKGTVNAINAIRFLMSTGNITSGTFTLYGYK